MQLLDVNVLVYAFRRESPEHEAYLTFVDSLVNGPQAFAVSDVVLSGFVRIVTHPRIFDHPDPIAAALEFVDAVRSASPCVVVAPGERHWSISRDLCITARVKGNLVPDAYLAAIAIEHGCELITTDQDFARFPKLRWRHPIQ